MLIAPLGLLLRYRLRFASFSWALTTRTMALSTGSTGRRQGYGGRTADRPMRARTPARQSAAQAINDFGIVVGSAEIANGNGHAFIYDGTKMIDFLGTPEGEQSNAYAINDFGQIIGDRGVGGFIYSNGVVTDLGSLGAEGATPNALNIFGQVVGRSRRRDGTFAAFLYSDGKMIDLNTLLPAGSNWILGEARGINDFGQIVGIGTNPEF